MRQVNAAQEAVNWLDDTVRSMAKRKCDLSLDTLMSVGSEYLVALEACARVVDGNAPARLSGKLPVAPLRQWIGRWRRAAAEATWLGLDDNISYKYWQRNIELPEVVERACTWFDTAKKLTEAVDTPRLVKFITDGERHLDAVDACRSSWPRFRYLLVERSFVEWNVLVARWVQLVAETALHEVQADKPDVATMELIAQQADRARDSLNGTLVIYEQTRMERLARKADKLKKRTCSHCGKTGPHSQLSFAYCGGCRHSGVARIDLPRYCSEACQRAHWAAGHKDECPCAKDL